MRDTPFGDMDPVEARLAKRVHDWLDQAVVPIDASAIARAAVAPRRRRFLMPRTHGFAARVAVGAAVLAFGLGGLLLIPGRAPSTGPGAMPSPSPSVTSEPSGIATPVEFSVRFQLSDCGGQAMDVVGGEAYARGAVCPLSVLEASDPRLAGDGVIRVDRDPYAGGFALSMVAHRIENDGGAWQEIPELAIEHPGGPTSTRTITLRGEGGYAGWTVVAELSPGERAWDLHGYIIAGEPPTPNPPTAPSAAPSLPTGAGE
jgi:hypothetical protein